MGINRDKPDKWKSDTAKSVDFYNNWFINFAPKTFRDTRNITTKQVEEAMILTSNLRDVSPELLQAHPDVLPMLRMSTCPPIARDRLIGLAGVHPNVVRSMEKKKRVPPSMNADALRSNLEKIGNIIEKMADPDIFVWLQRSEPETKIEIYRAATIVADRLCGAVADPIIRNAQEQRQLACIQNWLIDQGYRLLKSEEAKSIDSMPKGTFAINFNVPITQENGNEVNIIVDCVIMPINSNKGDLPLLIEAKSAGDYTNVNKRRKEEGMKMTQLRATYGQNIAFVLFLCGYFNSRYLGYEAGEGLDWVWEHRIDDLGYFLL